MQSKERLARLSGAAMVVSYSQRPFLATGWLVVSTKQSALRFLLRAAVAATYEATLALNCASMLVHCRRSTRC